MSDAAGGRLFAVPYNPFIGDPAKNSVILDHLSKHSGWFSAQLTPEEARIETAAGLVDTKNNHLWEVWDGGRIAGMLLLTRLLPGVDAVFHFTLFPGTNLFAARRLLHSFLGFAFETYDLQRISVEVPEHTKGLLAFLRGKLSFRFEGEVSCSGHPICKFLGSESAGKHGILTHDAALWLAKQGSRREHAHFDGKRFRDVYLLRLLRAEYLELALPAPVRATPESEEPSSDVARSQEGPVPTVH